MYHFAKKRRKSKVRRVPTPAPKPFAVIPELLNTAEDGKRAEALVSPDALAAWMVARQLLSDGVELSEADFKRVVELRDGLMALVRAREGEKVEASVLTELNRSFGQARLRLCLLKNGRLRVVPADGTFNGALDHLFNLVVLAMAEDVWTRFAICADPDCRTVFWDDSPKRARRWCTTRCGDRIRARAHRQKRRRRQQVRLG